MTKPTKKQVNAICYHLWKAGYDYQEGAVKFLEEELDPVTASDIIGWLMAGNLEFAIRQLNHLEPNLFKPYEGDKIYEA